MVLSRAVAGAYAAEWELPTPIYDPKVVRKGAVRPPIRSYYLYRCTDLTGTPRPVSAPPAAAN
jgi:hypothetical protein